MVRLSAGGSTIRLRLSNRYGTTPLTITGVTVAKSAGGAAVRPATTRAVTFGRGHGTVIPAGREAVSDAVRLPVTALDKLSVTLYVKGATDPATFHDIASATTFRARGVRVIGGTIMPFKGNPWLYPADNAQTLAMEKTRDAVSQWIRDGGEYDAVEPPALKLPVAGNF